MTGATGIITQHDFQATIEYTDVACMTVKNRGYYSAVETCVIHRHYFQADGREIGYWSPITSCGFIFETPRTWGQEQRDALN